MSKDIEAKSLYSPNPVYGVGLRLLACWDCGFEYRRGRIHLSLVSVVCYQVKVSAWGCSLVQRSPTDCSVCVTTKPRQ